MAHTKSFLVGCFLIGWYPLAVAAFAASVRCPRPVILQPCRHRSALVVLSASTDSSSHLSPGIEAIQQHNADLLQKLDALRESNYLSLFSVDILGSCEYMPQELFECYTESCEIYPVDEEEVGEKQADV